MWASDSSPSFAAVLILIAWGCGSLAWISSLRIADAFNGIIAIDSLTWPSTITGRLTSTIFTPSNGFMLARLKTTENKTAKIVPVPINLFYLNVDTLYIFHTIKSRENLNKLKTRQKHNIIITLYITFLTPHIHKIMDIFPY